ncbi:DNA-binding protein [Herbivorax sp. ANBcel31]|uniref:PPC domain-containing DNA-binding protein n=1 Tax=Herbivorax sp. ANBcel31 TaxID=3069754 RepID=UPI0027B23009|nr:PPC domain-containing DNA-binding protein [Herbivorax sp. ANBcel31]MDQ2086642.1 DNA-binding protein [Herbivorax sp. ANBcel31]
MKVSEGKIGRVFILRLEDKDVVPKCIEQFADENGIKVAHVTMFGGVGKGSVVVGPKVSTEMPPSKMSYPINQAHEVLASGLVAPDKSGKSILHIHGALGRDNVTITGCLREGVETWLVGEVIIYEILETDAKRLLDTKSGFKLLDVN